MARKIAMVKSEVEMGKVTQANNDLQYWLSKTPQERIATVTFLVRQMLESGERMDRSVFIRRKLKE